MIVLLTWRVGIHRENAGYSILTAQQILYGYKMRLDARTYLLHDSTWTPLRLLPSSPSRCLCFCFLRRNSFFFSPAGPAAHCQVTQQYVQVIDKRTEETVNFINIAVALSHLCLDISSQFRWQYKCIVPLTILILEDTPQMR